MKFAVVDGKRREAQPGLSAECADCGAAMIARCGDVRIWHWAHRGGRTCDPWWEPETEWHRAWKNNFPLDWQERSHVAGNGEKHRADVKTESGIVLEFQHSLLHPDERESREIFYPKLVWVVDAKRRKRDTRQFFESLRGPTAPNVPIYSVSVNESALLRDWGASRVPVYFDFGTGEMSDAPRLDTTALWLLVPRNGDGSAYLLPVPRTEFLRIHLAGEPFEEQCADLVERVKVFFRQRALGQPPVGFQRYMAGNKRRRRF
jgi:competence protein CoiA